MKQYWREEALCDDDMIRDFFQPDHPSKAELDGDRQEGAPSKRLKSAREAAERRWVKKARNAIEICRSCPVRSDCLEYALKSQAAAGVWGGVDFGRNQRSGKDFERDVEDALAEIEQERARLIATQIRGIDEEIEDRRAVLEIAEIGRMLLDEG